MPLPTHEAVLNSLNAAFASGEGIAILDGKPGTGKTLLALRFLESLHDEVLAIYVPSARFTKPSDLYQAILFDLGLEYSGLSEHELRLAVTERLLTELARSQRIVLVLDEAQHLSNELLEEIRLLDNWEARGRKALFTLLVTQTDLRERLQRPDCELFRQRVTRRVRIDPLSADESRIFLHGQLELTGQSTEGTIDEEATALLVRHGDGIPRILKRLAATSVELARAAGSAAVEVEAVVEALGAIGIELVEPGESAEPALSPQTTKSQPPSTGGPGNGRESARTRPPKQKAGTRRAA